MEVVLRLLYREIARKSAIAAQYSMFDINIRTSSPHPLAYTDGCCFHIRQRHGAFCVDGCLARYGVTSSNLLVSLVFTGNSKNTITRNQVIAPVGRTWTSNWKKKKPSFIYIIRLFICFQFGLRALCNLHFSQRRHDIVSYIAVVLNDSIAA